MKFIEDYGKLAIVYKEKEYQYKEVIEGIKYYSTLLDIDKEDRVVVFTENRPEIAFSIFAVWESKGTSVNLDGEYTEEELAYVLRDAEPKYIFTSEKNYETAVRAKESTGSSVEIIKFEDVEIPKGYTPDNYVVEAPEGDATAIILYTSGTTGNPKGVMLTTDNIMSNINPLEKIKLYSKDDRFIALLPLHHILPLVTNLLGPMYKGATIVMVDELSSEAIRGALQKYKITIMVGVPRLWEMLHKGLMAKIKTNKVALKLFKLCEKVENKKLSKFLFKKVHEGFGGHLRVMASGGAKLDAQIMEDFSTLGFMMLEGYGLTETSPIITFNRPEDAVAGSAGEAIPGVDVMIAEDGEVLAKGPNVMKGYFKNEEATSQVIDGDGWFHTGDLGRLEDGHLYILGRKKEMIVLSNGKNINPADIEDEIMRNTDLIKEMAVVEYHNHLMALVHPDFKAVKEAKIANIKEKLKWEIIDKYNVTAPKYRKILEIKIVKDELPKTKLGKLRRFKLKELLDEPVAKKQEEEKVRERSPEEDTVEYLKLKKYLKDTHDLEVTPESHLELDLGLDSLDIVEVLSFIEANFGASIHEEDIARISNVGELCVLIREKGGEYSQGDINWKQILTEDVPVDMAKSTLVGKVVRLATTPILKSRLSMSVEGLENLVDSPCIFAGNHQSFLDGFILNYLLPEEVRDKTFYLAISSHFESGFRKFIANRGNIILVDVDKNLKETLQIAAKVLREGKNLVIFPEGARTRDGDLQQFKKTFGILSRELNIPVVPFGIEGAYEAMPYGASMPNKGDVKIEFFKAIGGEEKEVNETVAETRAVIEKWLRENK